MKKDLFSAGSVPTGPQGESSQPARQVPLADRMRPRNLDDVIGQKDLLGPEGALRLLLESDSLPSLLLWGPPGCGKTTLARLVAKYTRARFLEFSAVAVGSKELKAVMGEARKFEQATGTPTILFLDEIHRFNKAQQDALLPWVERGDVTLIGATTENPSFEINSALISRTRLFVLGSLSAADIGILLHRALDRDPIMQELGIELEPEALSALAEMSEGDARAALGLLEAAVTAHRVATKSTATGPDPCPAMSLEDLTRLIQKRALRYDKSGEEHFNIISALHKSMRNSDVQASVYWLTRMLEGGEDPLYIARRLVRFASEDVGLADPDALRRALDARDAVHFIGMPEGALALAQAAVYLALAPKSNALYTGFKKARNEVARGSNPSVPLHLRNAPTRLMKGLDYGKGYVYAHDTSQGLADMDCLPRELRDEVYYQPGRRGFEQELTTRMEQIKQWHQRRAAREAQRQDDAKDEGGQG